MAQMNQAVKDIMNSEDVTKALADINAARKAAAGERGDNLKAIRNDARQKAAEFVGRMAKLSESK